MVDRLSPYYSPTFKLKRLTALCPSFVLNRIDLSDPDACADLFERERPDSVVHLAAQPGVRGSDHVTYVADNLGATANVLEGCRVSGARLVMASSSSIYGGAAPPFSEEVIGSPLSLYAATKQGCESMAQAYANVHGLSIAALRFFTVYGPWGRPDMAPAKFAHAILDGEVITLHGDGSQRRAFTYVDDAVSGTIAALDHAPSGFRAYNIGANDSVTVRELIEALSAEFGRAPAVSERECRPEDAPATEANVERALDELEWAPSVSFEKGVRNLAHWCHDYHGMNHGN